ncbi:hypothetical protein AB5N19_10252 [Seiridium cardinale]|uniref:Uncharacterized protein n=1 Tax=Seiridium cardinale TaxID=138064 RepID=A0ABR2X6E4_9PEZI
MVELRIDSYPTVGIVPKDFAKLLNTGSSFDIPWTYATAPAPSFAVLAVVQEKELAWPGVANVNREKVMPSTLFGAGTYRDIKNSQVFKYSVELWLLCREDRIMEI